VAYTSNGVLDTAFGNGGIVTTAVGDQNDENVGPFLVQPNGQIVFAGTEVGSSKNSPAQTILVRYNANGTLDTTFGSGGIVLTATAAVPGPNALALLSNGDYLVLGSNAQVEFSSTGALLSSTTTASVTAMSDTNPLFESNGDYTLASTVGPPTTAAVAAAKVAKGLRPEHMPINAASDVKIARFTETGSADSTFTSTTFSFVASPTTSANESSVTELAVSSSGQIIGAGRLAGSASNSPISIGLARLDENGGLDSTFGSGGVVTSAAAEGASGLLIQNDGNIVVLGESSAAAIVLVRFLAN